MDPWCSARRRCLSSKLSAPVVTARHTEAVSHLACCVTGQRNSVVNVLETHWQLWDFVSRNTVRDGVASRTGREFQFPCFPASTEQMLSYTVYFNKGLLLQRVSSLVSPLAVSRIHQSDEDMRWRWFFGFFGGILTPFSCFWFGGNKHFVVLRSRFVVMTSADTHK